MISTDNHPANTNTSIINVNSLTQLQPVQVQPQQPPLTVRNVVTDLISSNLSSRLIPKIGSIVKRFSLNYSGEGLVTDRQRVRTVRVGIRFQVQVDSFLNNQQQQLLNNRPRGISRANSAPQESIEFGSNCDNSRVGSDNHILTNGVSPNGQQLALEYSNSNLSNQTSPKLGQRDYYNSESCNNYNNTGEDNSIDSSSGVSSQAGSNSQSPVISRKHSAANSTLAFHNRINQALNLYGNKLGNDFTTTTAAGRRSSVQVLRRGSITPERSPSITSRDSIMEDSSNYQMLRLFPGSNIKNARQFSWETAAFENDVQDKIRWLRGTFSSLRMPEFVTQYFDSFKGQARENPITAVLIFAVAVAFSLPISIFLGFAVATILFTFLGFLFVEGTLLTVATVGFASVVAVLAFLAVGVVLISYLGYNIVNRIYHYLTGANLGDLLKKLPIIGSMFATPVNSERNSPMSSRSCSPLPGFSLHPNGYLYDRSKNENVEEELDEDYDEQAESDKESLVGDREVENDHDNDERGTDDTRNNEQVDIFEVEEENNDDSTKEVQVTQDKTKPEETTETNAQVD